MVIHVFLARLDDLDRFTGFQGQSRRNQIHGICMDSRAKMPPHGDPNNVHFVQGNIKNIPDQDSGIVERLGRWPDRDSPVRLWTTNTGFGFQLGMIDPRGHKLILHDDVRLFEPLVHVPLNDLSRAGNIVLNNDPPVFLIHLFVDEVFLGSEGVVHSEIGGKHLPFDLYRLASLHRQFFGFRGQSTEWIANLSHVVSQHLPIFQSTSRY